MLKAQLETKLSATEQELRRLYTYHLNRLFEQAKEINDKGKDPAILIKLKQFLTRYDSFCGIVIAINTLKLIDENILKSDMSLVEDFKFDFQMMLDESHKSRRK